MTGNARDEHGRFTKGSRPVGRPKGTRNKSTVLRDAFSKVLVPWAASLPEVQATIAEVAKDPSHKHWATAAKLYMQPFLEHLANDKDQGGGVNVQVNITGVSNGQEHGPPSGRQVHGDGAAPTARVIDAEGWTRGTEPSGG